MENQVNRNEALCFPKDFLWGVSTSAYQVEGGITNDWSRWENSLERKAVLRGKGLNPEDFICGRACDFVHKYEEDIKLVKELGCGAFRVSLEWAKIEPKKGEFDLEAIAYYRRLLAKIRENNLKTVVTIWHWTNPLWLAFEGGWANRQVANYFANYTEKVVKELGDLVDFWLTLNEPMVHVVNGYIVGKFPPSKHNPLLAFRVFNNLVKAHNSAYKVIHKSLPEAKVGLTSLYNYAEPVSHKSWLDKLVVRLYDYFWNDRFLLKTRKYLDYLGVDYYFHDRLTWLPPFRKNLNIQVTDLGWEIYPQGIYEVLKRLDKYELPIYIMENGLADATDAKRPEFIREHLKFVHQAIRENVDVRGYFHWSLLDNFEWALGWAPKFGLYEVDRQTFERKPRSSVEVYRKICTDNQLVLD